MPKVEGQQRGFAGIGFALPLVMITAYGSEKIAVEAMKLGAADYLPKPFDNDELELIVERALEGITLRRDLRLLREQMANAYRFESIIGKSAAMQRVFEIIRKVADTDLTVLIRGPSGTGKELVANAIHFNSLRCAKPLIKVNCAAFSRELVESELFGHERGAFTGAINAREGKFEVADARCSSMRSVTCRSKRRRRSCASCRSASSSASEETARSKSMCASSLLRIRNLRI